MATRERLDDVVVRLETVLIEGYRSCRNTQFSPNAGLSALIGVNGAGKTNVLQAIRLLDPRRGRGHRRGAEPSLSRGRRTMITAWFNVSGLKIGLRVTFRSLEGGRRDEFAPIEERWNLNSFTGSKAWRPMPPPLFLQRGTRAGFDMPGEVILFDGDLIISHERAGGFEKFDTSILENAQAVNALIAIGKFREGISYYSASQFTDPARCPSSFEVDEDGRLNEGYTVATGVHVRFLHDLYSLRTNNPDLYAEYCRFISRKQLGLISRLTWKEIELSTSTAEVKSGGNVKKVKKRKTLVIPKVQVGSAHITFNQLSEGTFKTLALAFYIITDSSQFLMIEEPEVCVHHGLLRRIVETIKAYSSRKQTIISTHSDLLVDELEPENMFMVEMTSAGTRVQQLEKSLDRRGQEALHTYLAESGPLGEYWRSGGLR